MMGDGGSKIAGGLEKLLFQSVDEDGFPCNWQLNEP